jgi:hypothetical protein
LVLAAKVFVVREESSLDLLAKKLKAFKVEEESKIEDGTFNLVSEVSDLKITNDTLEGVFSFDTVFVIRHRGKYVPVPRTFEAPFSFDIFGKKVFLTIFEKKDRANNVANEMSKALFMSLGQIVEARIQPEVLKRFHEDNFEDTKIIFYDDMDLPNIQKLSLYGAALGNTTLYSDYLSHGKLWYIVFRSKAYGYIMGLTRNCVITAFSKLDLPDFKNYIKREILPIIS